MAVADHLPLEQGLRLAEDSASREIGVDVADHLPLEQGLRLKAVGDDEKFTPCRRPSTIRTRIKTPMRWYNGSDAAMVADHLPLEQGLRHGKGKT